MRTDKREGDMQKLSENVSKIKCGGGMNCTMWCVYFSIYLTHMEQHMVTTCSKEIMSFEHLDD